MSDELLDAIAAEEAEPVDLDDVRNKAVELRDQYFLKTDLENRLREVSSKISKIERDELPDLFSRAKISSLTVEASGNVPAFVAKRQTVYSALIPEEKRMEAFEWLVQSGNGDLVKSVIEISFGLQEHEERLRVMRILSDAGVQFYNNESVHHMTLKAFVRRELQAGRIIPMDLLGAYIFDEVKIK